MNGLETEFDGQLQVIWLDANIQENEALENSCGLRGHPAFAVLDEAGAVAATFSGPQTDETLRGVVTIVLTSIRLNEHIIIIVL